MQTRAFTDGETSNKDRFSISAPPPDLVQPVEIVSSDETATSAALAADQYQISAPPDDVVQNVIIVEQAGIVGAFAGQDEDYRISAPPADVMQDVEIVSANQSNVMAAATFANASPPAHAPAPAESAAPAAPGTAAPGTAAPGTAAPGAAAPGAAAPGAAVPGTAVPAPGASPEVKPTPLSDAAFKIIRAVAELRSGKEFYAHVGTDAAGGLEFGMLGFTQASGLLGEVLAAAYRRDPIGFDKIFGLDAAELRDRTRASSPVDRLLPVAGKPLADPEWQERFRTAGAWQPCQYAQNEVAAEKLFRPLLFLFKGEGAASGSVLAVAFELAASLGIEEAGRHLSPLATPGEMRVSRIMAAAPSEDSRRRMEELKKRSDLAAMEFDLTGI